MSIRGPRAVVAISVCLAAALSTPGLIAHQGGRIDTHEICRLLLKPGNAFTRIAGPAIDPVARDGPRMLNINYSGFSTQQQAAFDYAAQIIETQMRSRVPLTIAAVMNTGMGAGVLGTASTGVLTHGSWTPAAGGVPAPIPNAFYLFSLGDHLQNRLTTSTTFPQHFTVQLNANQPWHLLPNAAPPAGTVDLISVALHELAHGVGFAGHSSVETVASSTCAAPPCGSVQVADTGFSSAFDYFLRSPSGVSLRNTTSFPHLSSNLAQQLTSAVRFDGPLTTHAHGGTPAVLYAPPAFAGGSSINHVDETTYPAGNINSLMTYAISSAEAVHTLGPVALGVMADLGWDTCAARLGSSSQVIPRAGGSLSLTITIATGCAWSIANSASFLTLTSATSGTGSTTVTFTVAANGGAARTGLVTINGIPHQVSQGSADVAAVISDPPSSTTVTAGQAAAFTVVAGGDPSPMLQWQLSTDGGSTFNNLIEGAPYTGTLGTTLSINPTTSVMNGHRVRVMASNGAGSPATSASATLTVLHAPVITTQPAAVMTTVGQAARFTIAATANPQALTYQWQRSTNGGATWTDLSDGAPFFFTTTNSMEVSTQAALTGSRFRSRVTNAIGTTTSSDALLTVRSFVTLSPSSLRFSATQIAQGGSLVTYTGSQSVTVLFNGAPGAWTATTTDPWISVTGGSGTGSGVFTVSLVSGVPVPTGINHGIVQFTSAIATNAPVVSILLSASSTPNPAKPIGQVDTPLQNATGVQGAIAVTGWALDDFGVQSVKIFRNCLPLDNPASCQQILRHSPQEVSAVYVGDAAFLAGARGDVESSFATYPQANRAGWGFLLLTSMLPHVTNGQPYGGQGPLTIYAVALDVEGSEKLLGRSSDPSSAEFTVPTTITMANDSIAKPFGAIDTPSQGQVVSGVLNNFGWALTPDSNTTGGESGDILIPTNGSTMTVFIDSIPVALVTANQCRGNVGNPVPGGVFCNDDVANIFGNPTPQATFTSRTTNPTRFRNLDAARGAIGSFSLDTTTLSNGLHTIAWSVTDSAGRTEGIGSRFFVVLNSGFSFPH